MNISENLLGVKELNRSFNSAVGASVEFLAVASDNMFEEFASRTTLIEDSGYNKFAELLDSGESLNICVEVQEDGSIFVDIENCGNGKAYSVDLSVEEENELYAFISDYCDSCLGESLTAMFGSAAMDAAEYQREAMKDASAAKYFDER